MSRRPASRQFAKDSKVGSPSSLPELASPTSAKGRRASPEGRRRAVPDGRKWFLDALAGIEDPARAGEQLEAREQRARARELARERLQGYLSLAPAAPGQPATAPPTPRASGLTGSPTLAGAPHDDRVHRRRLQRLEAHASGLRLAAALARAAPTVPESGAARAVPQSPPAPPPLVLRDGFEPRVATHHRAQSAWSPVRRRDPPTCVDVRGDAFSADLLLSPDPLRLVSVDAFP